MSAEPGESARRIPAGTLAVVIFLAAAVTMWLLKGSPAVWFLSIYVVLIDAAVASMIVIAAGGWAWPAVRALAPPAAPTGLKLATSVMLGLWLLATAMLATGSSLGALTGWLWWPVIAGGLALAAAFARNAINAWTPPRKLRPPALVWILIGLAMGISAAGITVSAGYVGGENAYDILEYHLQVPREYYHAGQIAVLEHNCYSFYPLGVEMLFLLGMILRGGAYEGMYLAKMLHASYALVAVWTVFLALRRDEGPRARFSAAMLASLPIVLFLSWQAMVELAMVCHLAVAVLWLRHWSHRPAPRAALCAGLMLGASCAVKYLSVGFVAAPVLAMMLICSLRRPGRLAHVALAAAATGALLAPWLVRNYAAGGNPVFPLATRIFGPGHWNAESEKRWVDGHSPDARPPVPVPERWQHGRHQASTFGDLYNNLLANRQFGVALIVLAGVGLCLAVASSGPHMTWERMLVGIVIVQVAIWLAFTRGSPPRFIVPVTVPLCLLAGGALGRLASVRRNPLARKDAPATRTPWGLAPAVVVFVVTVALGLAEAARMYPRYKKPMPPYAAAFIAKDKVRPFGPAKAGARRRIMLVGEVPAFYFPPGTVYATAFDSHPLAELLARRLGPDETVRRLRAMGVTHVWVNWSEMYRLRQTYGYPALLVGDFVARQARGLDVGTTAFERMNLTVVKHIITTPDGRDIETTTAPSRPTITIYAVPGG